LKRPVLQRLTDSGLETTPDLIVLKLQRFMNFFTNSLSVGMEIVILLTERSEKRFGKLCQIPYTCGKTTFKNGIQVFPVVILSRLSSIVFTTNLLSDTVG
jgi:hypothetical protein